MAVSQHGVNMLRYIKMYAKRHGIKVDVKKDLTVIPKTGVVSATLEREEVVLAGCVAQVVHLKPDDETLKQPRLITMRRVKGQKAVTWRNKAYKQEETEQARAVDVTFRLLVHDLAGKLGEHLDSSQNVVLAYRRTWTQMSGYRRP